MPLSSALASLKAGVVQCDNLIANAHKLDASGNPFLPAVDREQITVAAFLNFFIAWESFLEQTLIALMIGAATISGKAPTRFVAPPSSDVAHQMVVGTMRYFDYGNQDNFRKLITLYFDGGYPYEPHLSAIWTDLADLRTLRNASAHITSTTQKALETLALRILGKPLPSTNLYSLLTIADPRSSGVTTVFQTYRNKLLVAAELIANG